jgi:hypothetical protein
MKKIAFAFIAALSLTTAAQAQLKPEAGSIGFGFRINGIANTAFTNWTSTGLAGQDIVDPLGLLGAPTSVTDLVPQEMFFGRYYIASDLAIRVGLGINSASMTSEDTDTVVATPTVSTSKTSAFSFGITAGVEKHFASAADKLDPYAGAQLSFASLGGVNQESTTEVGGTSPVTVNQVNELPGGSSFGFDLLGGFNFFFTDNFALGAEFSWGFHSTKMGGDYTTETSVTNAGTTVITTGSGNSTVGQSGFRVGSTAGVNASVFF